MFKKEPDISSEDFELIKDRFQKEAEELGCMINLIWPKLHYTFQPKPKDDMSQLILDGMEMPKFTEFINEGE